MRWTSLALALLVVALATPENSMARKPKKKKLRGESPETTELTSACPTQHLETHYVYTGYGQGQDGPTAIKVAETDAWSKAVRSACTDDNAFRCAAARQHINQWGEPHFDPKAGEACFTYGLGKQWVVTMEEEAEQLEKHLAKLARGIREQAGEQPIRLEQPRWPSGCATGELGAALIGELRNNLTGATLADPGATRGVFRVELELASRADGVVLSASGRQPGEDAVTALHGFTFTQDLFSTAVEETGACAWDEQLGLEEGRRVGADGLIATPYIPSRTSLFCEGDTTTVGVRASAAAHLRVFTVASDGTAYLVWPLDGSDGAMDGTLSLGDQELIGTPDGGDERLVAVAVGADQSMSTLAGWNQWCRVPGAFGPELYPEGAAVGALTIEVRPEGERTCAPRPEMAAKLDDVRAALAAAPICGE